MHMDGKEVREQASVNFWGRESRKCKGPEAGAGLAWSRTSRGASVSSVREEL